MTRHNCYWTHDRDNEQYILHSKDGKKLVHVSRSADDRWRITNVSHTVFQEALKHVKSSKYEHIMLHKVKDELVTWLACNVM